MYKNPLKRFSFILVLIFFIWGCGDSTLYYDSEPACRIFFELTDGVMKDEMPINEIKIKIREIEITSMKSSDRVLATSRRFIRAAEEAVANYYDYPTFLPLGYDDTYETMGIHVESYLALKELSEACENEGYINQNKEEEKVNEERILEPTNKNEKNLVNEDLKIKTIDSAYNELNLFLKQKSWGFFGGTCNQWVKMDYDFEKETSSFINDDYLWKLLFSLKPDKFLGPKTLIYYVNPRTGTVKGDPNNNQNSPISEGCDQW